VVTGDARWQADQPPKEIWRSDLGWQEKGKKEATGEIGSINREDSLIALAQKRSEVPNARENRRRKSYLKSHREKERASPWGEEKKDADRQRRQLNMITKPLVKQVGPRAWVKGRGEAHKKTEDERRMLTLWKKRKEAPT